MTMTLQVYRDADSLETFSSEWNTLLKHSAADTLFLTIEFQRTWWHHLGEGELRIIAVREGARLVGIAPLFVNTGPQGERALSFVGCEEVADYLDFIVEQGREEAVLALFLDYLQDGGSADWDLLDLCNIRQDSTSLAMLPGMAGERGWVASTSRDDVCPVVELPGTWEEYLLQLSGKQRREIRRKLRRANAEYSHEWYIVGPEHDLEMEIEEFLGLMAASTPDKAAFLTPQMRGFFHELARTTQEAGWLQLAFLEIEGKKAAAFLNFVYNNQLLVYNSGLDWERFPRFGAGVVLTAYCFRHAIEQGWELLDFLQGDERYKYEFGGQDVEVRRLLIRKHQETDG